MEVHLGADFRVSWVTLQENMHCLPNNRVWFGSPLPRVAHTLMNSANQSREIPRGASSRRNPERRYHGRQKATGRKIPGGGIARATLGKHLRAWWVWVSVGNPVGVTGVSLEWDAFVWLEAEGGFRRSQPQLDAPPSL